MINKKMKYCSYHMILINCGLICDLMWLLLLALLTACRPSCFIVVFFNSSHPLHSPAQTTCHCMHRPFSVSVCPKQSHDQPLTLCSIWAIASYMRERESENRESKLFVLRINDLMTVRCSLGDATQIVVTKQPTHYHPSNCSDCEWREWKRWT